ILIAGTRQTALRGVFAVRRYTAAGALDDSFGNHGEVQIDFGHESVLSTMVLQSDGNILLAGSVENTLYRFSFDTIGALARLDKDGHPDLGFNGDGMVADLAAFEGGVAAITVQPDGTIVATSGGVLSRFNSNG